MEEKNDLINNIANDDNNMKRYLIIGGGIFTVFIVGIVLAKFLFSTPNDNTKVIVAPESNVKTDKEVDLFNSLPVEKETQNNDKNDNFVKPKIDNNQVANNQVFSENKEDKFKETLESETIPNTKPIKKVVPPTPKQNIEKPKVQNRNSNYYIQVAAVTRGEVSKNFLKLITKSGFSYKIIDVEIKGKHIKRVLVGPFSKEEVKKALVEVKSKISSSAFIKKLKWDIQNF